MADEQSRNYLHHIAQAGETASMWEAGSALDLDRNATEALATDLMAQGLLEMVSLDGKVRLTPAGRELLAEAAPAAGAAGQDLGSLLAEIKAAAPAGLSGKAAADLEADLACLEAQLRRSQALEPVVRACLEAVQQALAGSPDAAAQKLAQRAGALLA